MSNFALHADDRAVRHNRHDSNRGVENREGSEMNESINQKKLYEKLYVSRADFDLAEQYARFLLKKGWHSAPYERRGSIYMQQTAFTTSLVVSYSRPFTKSFGWPKFPGYLMPYDDHMMQLHNKILRLRHQVYAHSDAGHYSICLWDHPGFQTEIVGAPFFQLDKSECEDLVKMISAIDKLLGSELLRLRKILPHELP